MNPIIYILLANTDYQPDDILYAGTDKETVMSYMGRLAERDYKLPTSWLGFSRYTIVVVHWHPIKEWCFEFQGNDPIFKYTRTRRGQADNWDVVNGEYVD